MHYGANVTPLISARAFLDAEGVEDWRVLARGACATFRTDSFARGVVLVEAIGRVADELDHHPDVDLRYARVTVRSWSHDVDGLSERDVLLARAISVEARRLEVAADPSSLQDVHLTIGALVIGAIRPFWRAVLDYREVDEAHLRDPEGRGPSIRFQRLAVSPGERPRLHVDVNVGRDRAEARVAAALAAGGLLVSDEHAPAFWTLSDLEGNVVDVGAF